MSGEIAIIGGGRWGRVILSVLATADFPLSGITIVARHNADAVTQAIHKLDTHIPIRLVERLDETRLPQAAIIVNAARDHVATAKDMLSRGVHVYVEKPVALHTAEANELQALADARKCVLFPGLSFRFPSYLHNFAKDIRDLQPVSIDIKWADAVIEHRYGEQKTFDAGINVADDVMPHIWSILSVLFPARHFTADTCRRQGKQVIFSIHSEHMHGEVSLERQGLERQRIVTLTTQNEKITLDFSTEPGIIIKSGQTSSADECWFQTTRPMARQLRHFLDCIANSGATDEDRRALLESVAFSERASSLLEGV